jgi:hypothetical protein
MTPEQEAYLDRCEQAFQIFAARNPDYPATESHARLMAAELRAADLSPDNADHLQVVWAKIRPAPKPAQATEPELHPAEAEARRAIAEGRISRESIEAMSADQLQEASSTSLIFQKAFDLLYPPQNPSPLTIGDRKRLYEESKATGRSLAELTWDAVRAVEQSRRDYHTSINQDAPPVPKAPEGPRYGRPVNSGVIPTRRVITLEESRANEAANAKRAGRGMRSLSAHERQSQ